MMPNDGVGQIRGTRRALPEGEHAFRSQSPNVLVTAAGFGILIGFGVLYVLSHSAYSRFIDLWSFSPYRYPFLDAEYMSAQLEYWRAGVNVYVANPCDVLGRVQNLSPLWLRMGFLPSDKSWTNILGLTTDCLFLLSLMALPQPRRAGDAVPVLVSLASPSLLFALERANQDLIMFAIIVVAILLLERTTAARVAGSAAIILAALLKFYPIVLLLLLLRERPRTFLVVTVGGLVIMIACFGRIVMSFWRPSRTSTSRIPLDLHLARPVCPTESGKCWHDSFGHPEWTRQVTLDGRAAMPSA